MKKNTIAAIFLLFWGGLSVTSAIGQQYPPGTSFSCKSASGMLLSSDRLIPECADRPQRVMNASGATIAIIRPASEIRAEQARAAQEREQAQLRARLQDSKDELLEEYPTASAHDERRLQYLTPLNKKLNAAEQQIATFNQEILRLEELAKTSSSVTQIREDREKISRHLAVQQHIADTLRKQIAAVNVMFDEEKQLLSPLWKP